MRKKENMNFIVLMRLDGKWGTRKKRKKRKKEMKFCGDGMMVCNLLFFTAFMHIPSFSLFTSFSITKHTSKAIHNNGLANELVIFVLSS